MEILRGRLGAPTDEEMILSQDLFETLYHNKIIPYKFKINNLGFLSKMTRRRLLKPTPPYITQI